LKLLFIHWPVRTTQISPGSLWITVDQTAWFRMAYYFNIFLFEKQEKNTLTPTNLINEKH